MGIGDEGHITDSASGFFAPLLEQTSVAEGYQRCRIELEAGAGSVDPLLRAFKFGEVADRSFIQYAMAGSVGIFGSPLFIHKYRLIPELAEHYAEGIAVCDFGFRFDPALVARRWIMVGGHAFVGKEPVVAVSPDAENGVMGAKAAVGGVVEGVAFEGAWRDDSKAQAADALLDVLKICNAKLDFGFDGGH